MAKTDNLLTGGDLLARTLREAGVKRIFALHGGHHEALFKGCHEQGIELMDFRHESAAGHAADAYARTTGDLGVCIITAGPGFTNGVSAIANAKLDGSPVLFIIGAPPLREVETNPLQGGIDQIAMARPMTKWAFSIPTTERIPDLTAMAIRKARAGTKGPVVLELPIDVLHMKVPASRAAATRVSTSVRNSSKIAFCTAIFIARMRLSQRWIGGRFSLSTPSRSVSSSPLIVSNSCKLVLLSLPVASRQYQSCNACLA